MDLSILDGEPRAKRMLMNSVMRDRVPGAYLFVSFDTGKAGAYARALVKNLNCGACGSCRDCLKIDSGIHPDIIEIVPQGKKGIVKIDQSREVRDRVKYGPSEGKYMAVLVHGADKMETAAANAILKILEEPPSKVLFILMTDRETAMPRTVASRCQKVVFTSSPQLDAPEEIFDGRSAEDALAFSERFCPRDAETTRDELEDKFVRLAGHYAGKDRAKNARILLEAVVSLKKMANPRLLSDVTFLRLAGVLKK